MYKILVTDTIQLGDAEYLDAHVDYREGIARDELLEIVGDYDAIITRSRTQVDEALVRAGKNLKVIGRGGVGVDNIDIDAASRRGLLVLNAPEANNISAAELAVALMLCAARGVSRSDRLIRQGEWDRKFLGREVKGAKLGIVGIGRIGSLVSRRAQGLGMTVMAYDPYITRHRSLALKVELFDELDEMLKVANFLTVHTPLTDETRGMIGARELALLPEHAVVVNAARGGIIDEEALLGALESGHLFAAGLDVFVLEPPSADHPLLERDDVVLTAHLGANTAEAQARVGSEILERTVLALRGDYSRGVVNAPALSPEIAAALGPHLKLGEALGSLAAQLVRGRVRELQVEFAGTFAVDPDPIAVAVTKGFLEPILDEPPNYVNAPSIAKERDIRISKVMAARGRGYTSHVELRVITSEETFKVGGTVLGHDPRIVSINDYPIELKPEGAMLICSNYDRPGAVGKVGTVLGNAGVNISGMQLSRAQEDGLALFALTLDQVPPESVLDILRNMTDVIRTLSMVRF
ncbi:MAG: phosphoglycerate dehydrogenase [Deinococcota bacterium]|nr:phosphoglycerate dehydrogenase [Deinococcota bacterium]